MTMGKRSSQAHERSIKRRKRKKKTETNALRRHKTIRRKRGCGGSDSKEGTAGEKQRDNAVLTRQHRASEVVNQGRRALKHGSVLPCETFVWVGRWGFWGLFWGCPCGHRLSTSRANSSKHAASQQHLPTAHSTLSLDTLPLSANCTLACTNSPPTVGNH